jgi:hypothetical protein
MINTGTSPGHLTDHGQVYINAWRAGKGLSLFTVRDIGQLTPATMRRYVNGEVRQSRASERSACKMRSSMLPVASSGSVRTAAAASVAE